MKKTLVIVESPAKAKTIGQYLGSGFTVEASYGHVRDLPSTAAEIPAKHKGESWARVGVDVDKDFEPLYIVPVSKKAQVAKLKALAKDADALYLATDEDREGEAIAWHLLQVLGSKVPVKRMVFHEITKSAIEQALKSTRDLDQQLVDAQETRRILDRLFGYEVSPVLWRKVRPKLSAGRVQSVAVRLVVTRERARMRFVKAAYWDIDAALDTRQQPAEHVGARLVELGGKRVATGKDFDAETGRLTNPDKVSLLDEAAAKALVGRLQAQPFNVTNVVETPFTQRPYPPFITSSLQQEAARKLRYGAQRTMRLAQSLYENGYITYMRTDSTNLSQQAITAARNLVTEKYGPQFLPAEPRQYTKKAKGAQEAHEAIRPAGDVFRTPEQLRNDLDDDELRLYELVWKRTVASQMKDATGQRTSVKFEADAGDLGKAGFTASGKVITFPGFLRAYVEGSDDPEAELEDQEKLLPKLVAGQQLDAKTLDAKGHETQPPARYTEASLIKELEERGIGRPSTYASILQTIQDRGYVWKKATALVPTFTAFAVTNLLERHFERLVDYDFTARMEQDLDSVAAGERESRPWLKNFYFGTDAADGTHETGLKERIASGEGSIDPREICAIPLGREYEGQPVFVRVGRYGPYIQVGEDGVKANVPEEMAPDELDENKLRELIAQSEQGDKELGSDPETGKTIVVKIGRFGPYFQLGEAEGTGKKAVKPKMASLFPGMKPESVTLNDALQALSFPKELGVHPTTGETVIAQDGKFGPYLKMGTDTRSLTGHEQLLSVTLPEAVTIFEQPKQRRGAGTSGALAELGEHPESGAPLKVMNGRFGAYVTDGVVNASLPKGKEADSLTVPEAVELLNIREEKLKALGKDPRAEAARKAAKKAEASAKKSAPKETKAKKETKPKKEAKPAAAKSKTRRSAG